MGYTVIDEVGHHYGKLTVLSRAGSTKGGAALWLCHCSCGTEIVRYGGSLRSGATESCGCLRSERISDAQKSPYGVSAFNTLIRGMKRGAKQRGYTWDLTSTQVRQLTTQPCYYCGEEPSQGASRVWPNGVYLYNGLDRVDNKLGYIINNVVPCCGICNWGKKAMTQEEFLTWISRVYKYAILKEKDEALP